MLRVCVVLSMTDGRRMTSLGKNASGFGMDNLADGEWCPSPPKSVVYGHDGRYL